MRHQSLSSYRRRKQNTASFIILQALSFVQKELTEEVSDRINVGTAGEPDMHSCTIRNYYGTFRDKEEDLQLYCPKCGRQLAGNSTPFRLETMPHLDRRLAPF